MFGVWKQRATSLSLLEFELLSSALTNSISECEELLPTNCICGRALTLFVEWCFQSAENACNFPHKHVKNGASFQTFEQWSLSKITNPIFLDFLGTLDHYLKSYYETFSKTALQTWGRVLQRKRHFFSEFRSFKLLSTFCQGRRVCTS